MARNWPSRGPPSAPGSPLREGPLASGPACDEAGGLLASGTERPLLTLVTDARFGVAWGYLLFQGQRGHFTSGSQRKHHLSPLSTVARKSKLFLSFPRKDQTKLSRWALPSPPKFMAQVCRSFVLKLSLRTRVKSSLSSQYLSLCWTQRPPDHGSDVYLAGHRHLLHNFQDHALTFDAISFQSNHFLCIYSLHENLVSRNL